jgi:formate hydrogenlyase subunit 4
MSIHPEVAYEQPSAAGPTSRLIELFAAVALALSTVVAIAAVSIGIARADDVVAFRANGDVSPLAIALVIGLLFAAMGGLTAIMAEDRSGRRSN